MDVDLRSLEQEGVSFALHYSGEAAAEVEASIERLVEAWYAIGLHGGWGGHFGYLSALDWRSEDGRILEWWIDAGSADAEGAGRRPRPRTRRIRDDSPGDRAAARDRPCAVTPPPARGRRSWRRSTAGTRRRRR